MSNGPNGLTLKELVLEVRADVKDIAVRLDQKVDRLELVALQTRVRDIEKTQEGREHLVGEHETLKTSVDSLTTWRNRLIGALAVVGATAGVNVGRIWFGIG